MKKEFPETQNAGGLLLTRIDTEIPEGFTVAFATRLEIYNGESKTANYALKHNEGGVSARRKLCSALGVPFERLTAGKQVHGTRVAVVGDDLAGRGRASADDRIEDTDALVTGEPETPVSVVTADCLPVLVAAPGKGAAAVHAGWRGLFAGIVENAVNTLAREFGAEPSAMKVYVGPSIGPCCFQVREDVYGELGDEFRDCMEERDSSVYVNLWKICRRRLESSGIPGENIWFSEVCTCCHKDTYFSYRGGREMKGSNISLIGFRNI